MMTIITKAKTARLFLALLFTSISLYAAVTAADGSVRLSQGIDESAGGDPVFIISTPSGTYYLEKTGGGLSSLLDPDGVDWLGFHKAPGSAHKGEYRGFPNAVHRQDGNYFHAMNQGTDPSSAVVDIETDNHVRISFTSENGLWEAQWDFFPDRCDFTMSKVSPGYRYWVQYEGVPGGSMDSTDYWYASSDSLAHPIDENHEGDLPGPEWFAFGDQASPRVLYMLHHEDDNHPDDYVDRADMTVFAFGRQGKEKYLTTVQTFSIGFIESTQRTVIENTIKKVLK
ncbi:hypothetical protein OAC12_05240 [Porticoccaceae bacterium]|nr:hypothetical protein [Porticoccaceae bacterium]MDB9805524.1 hypothetical protein [Porticoccaceae bacterium]